ncbi:hypothetical protein [Roseibacillus persicicus]|uniref:Uncharacterized protein n=1 Tax=Roseibacillus persicicus TaxID=454148 RepID=A0A918WG29_9BACT|nr:hypothetical protein [Roseibacillus persicicus]GHC44222.1 hypothetical protein GCM10007100_06850 [Roseibacillus persicicus]
MDISSYVYGLFNIMEGIAWIWVAYFLISRRSQFDRKKVFWVFLSAPAFCAFAISDFIEAPQFGEKLPDWLWALKLVSGFIVFLSRVCYLGSKRKAEALKTALLGLILLGIALCLIFLF